MYNKVTLLRAFSLEDILKNEANKNNKTELQINTWEPFRIVIESKSKEHEIEANKIFLKNLRNKGIPGTVLLRMGLVLLTVHVPLAALRKTRNADLITGILEGEDRSEA